MREAAMVRRILRSWGTANASAMADTPTLDALHAGIVEELLVTPRFVDMHPDLATKAMDLARETKARVTSVTGVAAFELDLFGGGVGAVLRRSALAPALDASAA